MTKTILVIDDEDGIRDLIRYAIEATRTWRVLTAASGEAGMVEAETQTPDGILLDVMMPNLDGLTTLAQLKAHPATRTIPVVLLTAKAQTGEQQEYDGLSIAGVITKPFKAQDLAAQIAALLGWD